MPKKTSNGSYKVDVRPAGRDGPRFRRTFPTQREALAYERWVISEHSEPDPWESKKPDNRSLMELCELWYESHGKHLKDGTRRLRKLELICDAMGSPNAQALKAEQYLQYRSAKKAEPKTLNNELGYLNAVYNELIRTGVIKYQNPLSGVRPIKLTQNELSFLSVDEINELLNSIEADTENPHVLLITKICLATGCRWGEAESLRRRHVANGKITFTDTKSKKNRTIPIDKNLETEILEHSKGDSLFSGSITSFRRALARTSIELPKGQAAHVLRHTFASHFMMGGGDILTLQRILGHASITMTMRYAHLSPDHLAEAVRLNPLQICQKRGQNVDKSN